MIRVRDPQTGRIASCEVGKAVRVGRRAQDGQQQADFVVDSPYVSRKHCELVAAHDGRLKIVDHSAYGTKINGQKIAGGAGFARPGDKISLSHDCELHVLDSTPSAQPAPAAPPPSPTVDYARASRQGTVPPPAQQSPAQQSSAVARSPMAPAPTPAWLGPPPAEAGAGKTVTLAATGLVDLPSLPARVGQQAALELLRRHQDHVRTLLNDTEGFEIAEAQGRFLIVFPSATRAVDFGLRLQRVHNDDPQLPKVRVGVHWGSVQVAFGAAHQLGLEGPTVDLTRALETLAQPMQVLTSAPVFQYARPNLSHDHQGEEVTWRFHGSFRFQGHEQPLDVGEACLGSLAPELAIPIGNQRVQRLADKQQMTLNQRYRIVRELGRGGMGVVYQANDESLGKPCAIKLLLAAGKANPAVVERFKREAQLIRKVGEHPGIVSVYDLGVWPDSGELYLTMDFIHGSPLNVAIVQGLSRRDGVRHVAAIARAVEFAHQHGVVHRDLKPDNIMVTPEGEARLIDFGVAKALGDDSALSVTGHAIGTPSYMAPEQVVDAKHVDARADVYGLGAILYAALTRHPPFPTKGVPLGKVLSQVRKGELTPLSHRDPSIEPYLEQTVLRSMAVEPNERFQTAADFADALELWLRDEAPDVPSTDAAPARRFVGDDITPDPDDEDGGSGKLIAILILLSLAAGAAALLLTGG